MKEYKVKFMSDFEFENLPFKHVKESVGCANPKTKTAYIRKSNVPVMDQFVVAHEIEELVSKNSNHQDEDGIRYKGGGGGGITNILRPIAQVLSYIPSPIQPIAQAANVGLQIEGAVNSPTGIRGSTIGRAATGILSALPIPIVQPAAAAANLGMTVYDATKGRAGGLDIAGSAIPAIMAGGKVLSNMAKPAIQSGMVTPGKGGYGINTPSGVTNMGSYSSLPSTSSNLGFTPIGIVNNKVISPSSYAPEGVQVSPQTFQNLAPQSAQYAQNAGMNLSQPTAQTSANVPKTITTSASAAPVTQQSAGVEQTQTDKTPWLKKLFGDNWRTLAGLGISGAGNMFAPTPEPFNPEQSALFNETLGMVRSGAQVQLTPAQSQAITSQYDTALEGARQNLMDRYKALRPGSDIENDSQFRDAMMELESEFAEKKANALASAQLGLSAQQTQMMSELAAMDVNTLAMKAGIQYQEAREFKQMLQQLGYMVAGTGGMGGSGNIIIQTGK